MKRLDYTQSKEVDFKALYAFLQEFVSTCQNKKVRTLFYMSESLEQLQLNIQDNKVMSDYFFKKLKYGADQADHYIELERFVVYMNVLLGDHYEPLKLYKSKLLTLILDHIQDYFTSDEYCVIRHLVSFDIDKIIELGTKSLYNQGNDKKYFICEIYLLEQCYDKASLLLPSLKMEGVLEDYKEDYLKYQRKIQFINKLRHFNKQPFTIQYA